jgi:hypothetical protein
VASEPKVRESFAEWSTAFSDQYQLSSLRFEEFIQRYLVVFGLEFAWDPSVITRAEPGTQSPVVRLNQADMLARDEHPSRPLKSVGRQDASPGCLRGQSLDDPVASPPNAAGNTKDQPFRGLDSRGAPSV